MKHYYAYKSLVREKPSYCLLPLSEDAVYVDGMYYPDQKFLLLLSKVTKERYQMIPKIDDYGLPQSDKMSRRQKQDRIKMQMNYEHYISTIEDIKWFAQEFVENADEFIAFVEAPAPEPQKEEANTDPEPIKASEPQLVTEA